MRVLKTTTLSLGRMTGGSSSELLGARLSLGSGMEIFVRAVSLRWLPGDKPLNATLLLSCKNAVNILQSHVRGAEGCTHAGLQGVL